jgi:small nuclear ribonucleoprotein (snRNP)-like protein
MRALFLYSVRGFLIGRIIAFDRHFNLMMRNVTEEITAEPEIEEETSLSGFPVARYSGTVRASNGNAEGIGAATAPTPVAPHLQQGPSLAPPFIPVRDSRIKRRQLPQVLVRGDSIVCVFRAINR